MKKIFKSLIIIALLLGIKSSIAAGYPGLVVEKIWVLDGKVVVKFSDIKSDPISIQSVRCAYTDNLVDYKNVLALLLSAKASGNSVKVYTGTGGTSLSTALRLADNSEGITWASTITMLAIE